MRSSNSKFGRHAGRLLVFVALAMAAVAVIAYAGLGIATVFPRRKVVKRVTNDIADPVGDNYEPLPIADPVRVQGGSEISANIDDSVVRYRKYNAAVRAAALKSGWQGSMLTDTVRGRDIVRDSADDYAAMNQDAITSRDTMSREVTFFNL